MIRKASQTAFEEDSDSGFSGSITNGEAEEYLIRDFYMTYDRGAVSGDDDIDLFGSTSSEDSESNSDDSDDKCKGSSKRSLEMGSETPTHEWGVSAHVQHARSRHTAAAFRSSPFSSNLSPINGDLQGTPLQGSAYIQQHLYRRPNTSPPIQGLGGISSIYADPPNSRHSAAAADSGDASPQTPSRLTPESNRFDIPLEAVPVTPPPNGFNQAPEMLSREFLSPLQKIGPTVGTYLEDVDLFSEEESREKARIQTKAQLDAIIVHSVCVDPLELELSKVFAWLSPTKSWSKSPRLYQLTHKKLHELLNIQLEIYRMKDIESLKQTPVPGNLKSFINSSKTKYGDLSTQEIIDVYNKFHKEYFTPGANQDPHETKGNRQKTLTMVVSKIVNGAKSIGGLFRPTQLFKDDLRQFGSPITASPSSYPEDEEIIVFDQSATNDPRPHWK